MSKTLLNTLLIVLAFSMYYLVIDPLYTGSGSVWQPEKGISALKDLNQQYDETISQATSLKDEAQSLKEQYTSISPEQKAKMMVMVPNSIDQVRLLSEFSGMLTEAGLASSDLSVNDAGTVGDHLGAYNVIFSVKTTYPAFKDLMDTIEKSLRLYTIKGITFSAPEKDESGLSTYQVQLETYYIK